MIYQVVHDGKILAIILYASFQPRGVHFVTPPEFSQQLGYMRHSAGKRINPHFHNPVPREVIYTQEVLFLKHGRLRVDFYDDCQRYLESHILVAGDTILLASGGHGFEVLEDLEMIEVKQGPYSINDDKTQFEGITADQAILPSNRAD